MWRCGWGYILTLTEINSYFMSEGVPKPQQEQTEDPSYIEMAGGKLEESQDPSQPEVAQVSMGPSAAELQASDATNTMQAIAEVKGRLGMSSTLENKEMSPEIERIGGLARALSIGGIKDGKVFVREDLNFSGTGPNGEFTEQDIYKASDAYAERNRLKSQRADHERAMEQLQSNMNKMRAAGFTGSNPGGGFTGQDFERAREQGII